MFVAKALQGQSFGFHSLSLSRRQKCNDLELKEQLLGNRRSFSHALRCLPLFSWILTTTQHEREKQARQASVRRRRRREEGERRPRSQMKRVVKDAVSKASNYLRHDFKEIVNPSAMPNPEWYKVKESAGKTSLWEFVKVKIYLLILSFFIFQENEKEWNENKLLTFWTSFFLFLFQIFGLAFREYSIGWKHFVLGTTREKEKEGGGETKEGGGKEDDAMKGSSSTEDMCKFVWFSFCFSLSVFTRFNSGH